MSDRFNCTPRGRVRVMETRCSTCIFRSGNPMRLRPGRVREMVEGAVADDSAIICHDTLDEEEQAVCRGFFDAHDTQPLQLARRLQLIEPVAAPPEALEEERTA